MSKAPEVKGLLIFIQDFLNERIVFLGGPIDDNLANIIVAQILFLESVDKEKDINLYINSPGGSVTAGLAIYDAMQYVSNNVSTMCFGWQQVWELLYWQVVLREKILIAQLYNNASFSRDTTWWTIS